MVHFLIHSNWPTSSRSEPQSYQHRPGGGGRGQLPRIPAGADARGGAGDFNRNWSSDCPWDDVREWGNVTEINVLVCWRDDGVINTVSYFLQSLKGSESVSCILLCFVRASNVLQLIKKTNKKCVWCKICLLPSLNELMHLVWVTHGKASNKHKGNIYIHIYIF